MFGLRFSSMSMILFHLTLLFILLLCPNSYSEYLDRESLELWRRWGSAFQYFLLVGDEKFVATFSDVQRLSLFSFFFFLLFNFVKLFHRKKKNKMQTLIFLFVFLSLIFEREKMEHIIYNINNFIELNLFSQLYLI